MGRALTLSFAFVFVPLLLMSPMLVTIWVRERKDKRLNERDGLRHPLLKGLLRPAGYSLAESVRNLQINALWHFAECIFFGLMIFAFCVLALGVFRVPSGAAIFLSAIPALGYAIFKTVRFRRAITEMRRKRLGWEGEMATGEELNQLMRFGYSVYHDIDCGKFNIDHVAVGPGGVFAVETKARTKKIDKDSIRGWRAIFDGHTITFGSFRTDAPVQQAQRCARWLSEKLTTVTAERTPVTPVVSLPGWYVDRTGPSHVRVVNPQEFTRMIPKNKAAVLSDLQIRRISEHLDSVCRDVAKDKTVTR